jgi:hypothetical protein
MSSLTLHYLLNFRCIGDNPNIPQSAQNQTHEPSDVSDSSGPIFNMYVKMAEEEDKIMTDRWQKDADGILIFVSTHRSHTDSLRLTSEI